MRDTQILICYDGSDEAHHAIDVAAELLGPRRAVVLDIGPVLTTAESFATLSSVVPGTAFEDLNEDDALQRAPASRRRRAARPRPGRGKASSTSLKRSTRR